MGNYPRYTAEEIQFLREFYPTHSFAETYKAFCDKFGEYTEGQVRHRLKRNHITNNFDGKFQKGLVVWNRGLSIKTERPDLYEMYKNINHDAFIKSGKSYWKQAKPIGTEILDKGSYKVKVGDNRWISRGRYVYEKHYGITLDKKDRVLHIDGDRTNDDIDNLVVVSDAILARLNKLGLLTESRELNKVIVTKELLLCKIREIENDRAGNKKHKSKS